jgi:hypothetical protein
MFGNLKKKIKKRRHKQQQMLARMWEKGTL